MRRSLCACLLAIMVLAGGAQADWYWGPIRHIVAQPDTDYTNSNNARCIVEKGGKIHVVFVRDTFRSGSWVKQVYYMNSTDWGASWCPLVRLSQDAGVVSRSPSIGLFGRDTALVIYNDGTNSQNNDEGTQVWSRISYLDGSKFGTGTTGSKSRKPPRRPATRRWRSRPISTTATTIWRTASGSVSAMTRSITGGVSSRARTTLNG